jgi:anti-sigma regulatory factor (Ser/Thr protein kinase)
LLASTAKSLRYGYFPSPEAERRGETEMLVTRQSRFRISATQSELPSVTANVDAFCIKHGIPSATSNLVNLALDEVLSNIVKYAYDASNAGPIDVELAYSGGRLSVTVEDDGTPFDPLKFKRLANSGPLSSRKPGRLGILFVKRLMDSAIYERSDGRNRMTLVAKVTLPQVAKE